jgi:hypothetical protein
MQKINLVAMFVLASATAAHAGGQEGSIGAGAEFAINGTTGGLSINYDTGVFHVGGFFGLDDPSGSNNTVFALGGRFYYHAASSATADFGVGGTLGLLSRPDMTVSDDRELDMYIEPGFQIRAFIASNVALSFSGGIVIGAADAGGVIMNGQLNAFGGVHYYFY